MIYVDDMRRPARVGRTQANWSHLTADTREELLTFAVHVLGLKPAWRQAWDTRRFHFDVTDSVRQRAIRAGAEEITYPRGMAALLERRRAAEAGLPPAAAPVGRGELAAGDRFVWRFEGADGWSTPCRVTDTRPVRATAATPRGVELRYVDDAGVRRLFPAAGRIEIARLPYAEEPPDPAPLAPGAARAAWDGARAPRPDGAHQPAEQPLTGAQVPAGRPPGAGAPTTTGEGA
jgi:hypothetical protein